MQSVQDAVNSYGMMIQGSPGAYVARYLEVPLCYGMGLKPEEAAADLAAIIGPYLELLVAQGAPLPVAAAVKSIAPATQQLGLSGLNPVFGGPQIATSLMTLGAPLMKVGKLVPA